MLEYELLLSLIIYALIRIKKLDKKSVLANVLSLFTYGTDSEN